ncbi:MAG: DUF4156 domain-containing protein [Gammaproteobacteria bacterium]|nr:DUF4156 domain-containing protein [Gammaproteobacteria bacterium]
MASGCTWVDVDEEATRVRLVTLEEVEDCERLGTTNTTTKADVGPLKRKKEKIAAELLALAQNSAANMGGDTLVAQGPITNGARSYTVYRCGAGQEAL